MPESIKRLLLDENLPIPVRHLMPDCDVWSVARLGWAGLDNGTLIDAAERAGFDVFLTADKNLAYQQNLAGRRIALVVIESSLLPRIKDNIERVQKAIARCTAGAYVEVRFS